MSGPSSPKYQIMSMNNSADENVITRVNLHEDMVQERRKRIAFVCDELNRLKSLSTSHMSKSTAAASLKGLKMFIGPTEGDWTAVERRFDKMRDNTSGLLTCSKFGECIVLIGFELENHDFESILFIVNWLLNVFELKFMSLIAYANNMSTIKNKADEYASQIMDEFDPDEFGYITVEAFEMLFKELETHCVTSTEETEKPTMLKRLNKVIEAISSSSLTIIDEEIVKQDLR
ncbi:EF-hand domain pair [Arabidopsis thaliana x Arabidopsis arenosa]|uniref:EF-hand domain pair n=1 Tax=Arabidopsis thaliana x Arabidopsis arenosa TaxID=1240361 RepID=A0A8T2A4C8_9BRAS|nr:EF-hand domain pair [Arabidopsis thaliana x Arabidopsis arenosa]